MRVQTLILPVQLLISTLVKEHSIPWESQEYRENPTPITAWLFHAEFF